MVFRWIFRNLANNEKLVARLAESYPIRRAAQLSVYLFTIGRAAISNPRLSQSAQSLAEKLQAQLKDVQEELKKRASK